MSSRFRRPAHPLVLRPLIALAAFAALGAGCQPPGAAADSVGGAEPQERGGAVAPAGARPPLERAWVIFGADTVVAELAKTDAERSRGLMFRDNLPDGTGMLFVFPDVRERSFWMRETYIPLDVAFMDSNFTVVDIQSMEPESTEAHTSAHPAAYALEVPQGWFAARGIEVGAVAEVVF